MASVYQLWFKCDYGIGHISLWFQRLVAGSPLMKFVFHVNIILLILEKQKEDPLKSCIQKSYIFCFSCFVSHG